MNKAPRPRWAHRFIDPDLFEREQAAFGRSWTLLGLLGDIPEKGDWIRASLGSRSVFVQRFDDGVRGFHNVCAHRFYPLRTEDRGNGPVRCGFHHWQYNQDGVAVGIPKCMEMFGVKPLELGARLEPIDVETCGGLIFGRLATGNAESLREYLGQGFDILAAMTDVPTVAPPQDLDVAANWKLTCHISLDDYHLVAVHPDTFGKAGYLGASTVRYYRFGRNSAYFYDGQDDDLTRMAEECRAGAYRPRAFRTFHLFPNLVIAHAEAAGSWWVVVQRHEPVAVDRTLLRTWCLPLPMPLEDRGMVHGLKRRLALPFLPFFVPRFVRKIALEDNDVCEGLQAHAGQADGQPFLARHEERIGWFDEEYERWLGRDADPDSDAAGPVS